MSSTRAAAAQADPVPHRRRRPIWAYVLGGLAMALLLLVLLWDWNWFRPLVERQASAAIGRKVAIGHFDIKHFGFHPTVLVDDVTIANPDGFPAADPLAHIDRLAVDADAAAYLHDRSIVLPRIELDRPNANVVRLEDGRTNYALKLAGSGASSGPPPRIGELVIAEGTAHVVDPKFKADFRAQFATQEGGPDGKGQIVASADGTYAGQPITIRAVAGALLSLRDAATPYPIDAHLANGPTKLDLTGTIQDPLQFQGSTLQLHLSGPDMGLLSPLLGFAFPATPNYDVAGRLDYADKKIRMTDMKGRLGASDISGSVSVDPAGVRPNVEADLASKHVDLADLGGLVGSQPGRVGTPGQTAEQRQQVVRAEASSQLLPTKRIDVPTFKAADVHVRYKGAQIVGKGIPFDSLAIALDIDDGTIKVHPVSLGVGSGHIDADLTLVPAAESNMHLTSDIRFERVDVGRMLESTGAVKGAGRLGGRATLDSTGNSVATLVGRGNGEVRLMLAGGNLSALIVDLSGLQFGNALLSAIGLPNRATLQCFVADLALKQGVLDTRTLLAVTSEADIGVTGKVDLSREVLDYRLRTDARHFNVGSLPTDIKITGPLKKPSISPAGSELATRAGAAVVLGVVLTPLAALLPTIQFGTGDENASVCAKKVQGAK